MNLLFNSERHQPLEKQYPGPHDWAAVSTYPLFSATQMDTYLDCERKWGLRYIAGLPDKKDDGPRDFGKKVHSHQDMWLKHGTKPPDTPEGRVMATAIRWLPNPGTCSAEHPFEWIPNGQPFALRGSIDCLEVMGDGVFRIEDTKVTGSNFRWMKTAGELRTNVQAVVYSSFVAQHYRVDLVRCRWIYCLRTNDKRGIRPARPVDFEMPLEHLAGQFEIVCEIGRRMVLALEQKVQPEDLPCRNACNKYGGCPYLDNGCGMTPQERFRVIMTENNPNQMTLLEKANAHVAATGQQLPAQPVNPPESQGHVPVQQVPPPGVAGPQVQAPPAQTQAALSAQGMYGGPPAAVPTTVPMQPPVTQPMPPSPPGMPPGAQAPNAGQPYVVQVPITQPIPNLPPAPPPQTQLPQPSGPPPASRLAMPLELSDAVKALELVAQGYEAAAQYLRTRAEAEKNIPF